MWEQLRPEFIKAVPNALLAATGAFLALGIGKWVAEYWALRQKRRELELAALNEFYRLYGEFFAVWKLWNQQNGTPSALKGNPETSWKLLERVSGIEAGIEALIVKVTTERKLEREDVENLGLLRQAFKSLRRCMREGNDLDWTYSEHEEYLAFKRLACGLTALLLTNSKGKKPNVTEATGALLRITTNEHALRWQEIQDKEKAKRSGAPHAEGPPRA
jgi:hypothetical protein